MHVLRVSNNTSLHCRKQSLSSPPNHSLEVSSPVFKSSLPCFKIQFTEFNKMKQLGVPFGVYLLPSSLFNNMYYPITLIILHLLVF